MKKSFAQKILIFASLLGVFLFLFLALAVKPTVSDDSPTYITCAEALARFQPADCNPSRTPGYPLFILLTDTIFGGLGYQISMIVQYLLVLGSAFLIYRTSLTLFSDTRIGLLAFALVATYPLFLFYSNNVLTEIPFMFLLTAAVYACVIYARTKKLSHLAAASLLLGLATLVRPYALFFLPLWVIYLGWSSWKNWKILARDLCLAVALFAIVIMPWVIKNTQQFGKPALHYLSGIALATNVYRVDGLSLVDSKLYEKEKTRIKEQDPQMLNPYQALDSMGYNPAEIDGILTSISLESIFNQPLDYAKGAVVNFVKLAFYPKYAYGDYLVIDQTRNLRPNRISEVFFYIYRDLQYKLNYPVILLTGLGILGMILSFRKSRAVTALLASLIFLSLIITAATIIPNVRYRVVTDQFFILFASVAVIWLWDKMKSRLQKRL